MTEHQDEVFEEAAGVMMNGATAAVRAAEALARRRQGDQQGRTRDVQERTEELQRRYEAQAVAAERFYASSPNRMGDRAARSPEEAAARWRGAQMWAELDPRRFTVHADRCDRELSDVVGTDLRATVRGSGVPLEESGPTVGALIASRNTARELHDQTQLDRTDVSADLFRASDPGTTDVESDELIDAADDSHAAAAVDFTDAGHERAAADTTAVNLPYDSHERRGATEQSLRTAGVSDRAIAARMTSDRLNGQHPHTAASSKHGTGKRRARAKVRSHQKINDSGLEQ